MPRFLGLAAATATAAAISGGSSGAVTRLPPTFAVLTDRVVVKIDTSGGRVVRKRRVGPPHPFSEQVGDELALSGGTLYVLTPPGDGVPQAVTALDSRTLAVKHRYALPSAITFRSLVRGPRTGRLYLAGNNAGGDAFAAVLDPRSEHLETTRLRSGPPDWYVFATSISRDERRLFVSYHGAATTGADWVVVRQFALTRCSLRNRSNVGCLSLHGDVAPYGKHVLATTGDGPVVELDLAGRTVRRLNPRIPLNHLIQFALDHRSLRLLVIGSCAYAGGLSAIDLRTGRARALGYPHRICGERVVPVSSRVAAVAANAMPVPQGGAGVVETFDLRSGARLRTIDVEAEPVDLTTSYSSR